MNWFEVDQKGLRKLLARRGKQYILCELLQNAWDEHSQTVHATLQKTPTGRNYEIVVQGDNPLGFKNLSHAFTLFAESTKNADPEKRGRFNLGEKLVLAVCQKAQICSTNGTVSFNPNGKKHHRTKTKKGSRFTAILPMTDQEAQACHRATEQLIPPPGDPNLLQ
jgi:hypothetical protein